MTELEHSFINTKVAEYLGYVNVRSIKHEDTIVQVGFLDGVECIVPSYTKDYKSALVILQEFDKDYEFQFTHNRKFGWTCKLLSCGVSYTEVWHEETLQLALCRCFIKWMEREEE